VLLLAEADRNGRIRGYAAPTLDEAMAILRALDQEDDGEAVGDEEDAGRTP